MQNKANWFFPVKKKTKFKKKMVRNKMPRLGSCSKTLIKHIVAFSCCFWVTAFLSFISSRNIVSTIFFALFTLKFVLSIHQLLCVPNKYFISAFVVCSYINRRLRRHHWLQIKLNLLEVTYCCLICLKYK